MENVRHFCEVCTELLVKFLWLYRQIRHEYTWADICDGIVYHFNHFKKVWMLESDMFNHEISLCQANPVSVFFNNVRFFLWLNILQHINHLFRVIVIAPRALFGMYIYLFHSKYIFVGGVIFSVMLKTVKVMLLKRILIWMIIPSISLQCGPTQWCVPVDHYWLHKAIIYDDHPGMIFVVFY